MTMPLPYLFIDVAANAEADDMPGVVAVTTAVAGSHC